MLKPHILHRNQSRGTIVKHRQKIGRNDQCPCKSGKKYKKCCLDNDMKQPIFKKLDQDQIPPEIFVEFERHKAKELIRTQQQGLGNPIISCEYNGYRIVAIRNKIYWSKNWKTFHDFLMDYIKDVMKDGDWGSKEIAKPYAQRHPILQWYDQVCQYSKEITKNPGKISSLPMIGAVKCYLSLAYNLYLIGHNKTKNTFSEKLQKRLIDRLKNQENFPGAYYESYVSAILIQAGYEVEFANETEGKTKLCDFNITNKTSGKKFTVEAKSICRDGALGAQQNTTQADLRFSIRNQLHKALSKPSEYPRIIFIEVNLPDIVTKDDKKWIDIAADAVREAEDLTIKGSLSHSAYVFLTNHPHHYYPGDTSNGRAAVPVGYKIRDFGFGSKFPTLREMYYAKKKHIDIHNISESMQTHDDIPATFDGSLPSETFNENSQRLIIGKTYFFGDIGESGLTATVTCATVNKHEKIIYIGTDKGHILTCPISDAELLDYENHPDAFFGVIHQQGKNIEDPLELFEWFLSSYKKTSKEKLLEFMNERSDIDQLKFMSQEELSMFYCEQCVYSVLQNHEKQKAEELEILELANTELD
jgi:hypothetical protein